MVGGDPQRSSRSDRRRRANNEMDSVLKSVPLANRVQNAERLVVFCPRAWPTRCLLYCASVIGRCSNLHLSTDGVGTHLLSEKSCSIASFGFSRAKLGSPGWPAGSCAPRCGKGRCCWTISTQFPAIASERVPGFGLAVCARGAKPAA